jgi:hypothetical protein
LANLKLRMVSPFKSACAREKQASATRVTNRCDHATELPHSYTSAYRIVAILSRSCNR